MSRRKSVVKVVFFILISLVVVVFLIGAKLYFDIKGATDSAFYLPNRILNVPEERLIEQKKSLNILLLGIDTGELGRSDQGRSDSMILASINPQKKQTLLTSLQRDTYTEIVGADKSDKLNHAYVFGGAGMTMDSVQNLLNIQIDYYVTLNMKGIEALVDLVDGVTVDNEFTFTYEGTTFNQGKQELDSTDALKYSRMRKDDPKGDYGRQKRQQQILSSLVKKMVNPKKILKVGTMLDVLGNNVKTNLTFSEMSQFLVTYRDALTTINTDQLQGTGFIKDGISYQQASQEELARLHNKIIEQMQ